ncbi:unnamed protein product, partial [Ectocarpus sp. 12 AP-2014]
MDVLNINVGILGHVDSGKTSLVKALSTVLSTASLDKNPQSRERGITLDLGFSAFTVSLPEHLPQDQHSNLQFTLVSELYQHQNRATNASIFCGGNLINTLAAVHSDRIRLLPPASRWSSFRDPVRSPSTAAAFTRTLPTRQVDCPGHASLIRTIIGGAQIMDMMLLVVDATKGMQAQTTECVVIGEAVMSSGADVIVVLNKVDLIPEQERKARLRQA